MQIKYEKNSSKMTIYRCAFKQYLEDLAKKKPSPGGGSAICLIFCIGVSLLQKALRYSLPSSNLPGGCSLTYIRLFKTLKLLEKTKTKINLYIDRDAALFDNIMAARGRRRLYFLAKSEELIIDTGRRCIEAFLLAKKVESGIKKGIISDFYIGKECVKLALGGCLRNLEANETIFGRKNKYIKIFKRRWERF